VQLSVKSHVLKSPTSFLPRVAGEDEGGWNHCNFWNDWNQQTFVRQRPTDFATQSLLLIVGGNCEIRDYGKYFSAALR
jgi:hypothetical protein